MESGSVVAAKPLRDSWVVRTLFVFVFLSLDPSTCCPISQYASVSTTTLCRTLSRPRAMRPAGFDVHALANTHYTVCASAARW